MADKKVKGVLTGMKKGRPSTMKEQVIADLQEKTPPPVEHRNKVVRDAFTFPDYDHALIKKTQERLLRLGHSINKSEIMRAGLHALRDMSDKDLEHVINRVGKIKVGRPEGS